MNEKPYAGLCIGGPFDGMSMASEKRQKIIYGNVGNGRADVIGQYEFQRGEWYWVPEHAPLPQQGGRDDG